MTDTDLDQMHAAERPKARPRRFGAVVIWMHWTTVVLIVALFASALSIGLAANGDQADLLLTIHRSLGVTTWIVALCRLGWRLTLAYLPPFPETMPKLQQKIATLSEYALYALMLTQPLTGLAQSFARGRPFHLFSLAVPQVMERDKGLVHLFSQIHEITAWTLLGLICVHVLAALFHRFILNDEVFQSMAPWKPKGLHR